MVGFSADFIGARATVWISLFLQGSALYTFAFADELWHFVFAAAIHGIGYSALSPIRTFILAENIGIASLGSSLGLLRWVEMPFAVSASPLAGFVFDATGSYSGAFLVLAGLIVIAAAGPFFIQEKRVPVLGRHLGAISLKVRRYLRG